jgi:hypothetical protein
VTAEARLGACDGCEEFVENHRELDLRQKAAEVALAEEVAKQGAKETERYDKRLAANELDDPTPGEGGGAALKVIVEQPPNGNTPA